MKHFHSGYILDIIADKISLFEKSIENSHDKELLKIKGLLAHVASFDVQFPPYHEHNSDLTNLNSFLATLNNIISRGLPTKAPLIVEEKISELLKRSTRNEAKQSEIKFQEENYSITYEKIFELLHIVEPQLEITKEKYVGYNVESEWQFLINTLANYPFARQILQPQRLFSTISAGMAGEKSVDFCFQSPYLHWDNYKETIENISRIFEVDGRQHELWQYKIYDNFRDDVADNAGFETLRVPVAEISQDNTAINELFNRSSFQIFENNYNKEIENNYEEYILIFTPLAIGRIQKTLIELFLGNEKLLNQSTLKIAIIERDVPCGALAVENLEEYFYNLNSLLNDESKIDLPKIELTIYPDNRFKNFNSAYLTATIKDDSEFQNIKNSYDIILDHSILRRSGIYKETNFQSDKNIIIRSSHYNDNSFGNTRRTYCSKPLKYKTLVEKQNDGSFKPRAETENSINYFIRNIFRKVGYREGQLPIISRALQQLPVIGLIPTGGGKSLTFQLSVLMQPGLCVVVDPIKSLMEDQVRVLKENWIDCCDYINSTLSREEKRNRLINFRYGETQILFVSPERFVMVDFRLVIKNINSFFGLAISYCVIDEVHCVSEWGHDFRDTYLFLGKNAQEFCNIKYKSTKNQTGKVSLIGLTATASFDVLADVERELKIEHSDIANAVIMIENTIRPEMFYRVIVDNNPSKLTAFQGDFDTIGSNLQFWNKPELLQ
ncbi:MAG: DEAD/DEAH box helicase, partial [Ignavibacteria bacterium]|nr:DEAD/DEAH box helicase [Ignavibacteria bacterium]